MQEQPRTCPENPSPKPLTNSAQLSGAPVKHSLWGELPLGSPSRLVVSVPLTSSSEAKVAQVSGLARLNTLGQEDGYYFRVEHSCMFRNT